MTYPQNLFSFHKDLLDDFVNLLERIGTKPLQNWSEDGSGCAGLLHCFYPRITVTDFLLKSIYKIDHTMELNLKGYFSMQKSGSV